MTEELKKWSIADDVAAAETVEETGATPDLEEDAKAAEREARRQALYEENERAEEVRPLCMPIKEILELIPGTK
ncbi:MAG: hypothetical protein EGR35_10550 [Collinsella aerofaciens]|nr:hypothetical protein [Collinsella aerofaciens]